MAIPNYFTCPLGQAALYKTKDDNFTNINDFIEKAAHSYGDLPAVGFYMLSSSSLEPWEHRIIKFSELFNASCATAHLISEKTSIPDEEIVALLCPSTPAFLFTWLALMRLGHPVLLIAPQCSPHAIAELCSQCGASTLFYDETYEDLSRDATEQAHDLHHKLQLHSLLFIVRCSLFDLMERPPKPLQQTHEPKREDIAYLHHTSGTSTGVPKPIPQSHNAGVGVYAQFDGTHHATFTTTPLYHGGIADLFRAWTSRALIWLFPEREVPITAANVVKCLKEAANSHSPPVRYFSSVPYVLQMMAADLSALEYLRRMDAVGVGGAALPASVGDQLVTAGVNLVSRFGSAECGFMMSSQREYPVDMEWQFLRAEQGCNLLHFEPRDRGLFELIVLPGWPHMANSNREDGSFATSDLFVPHSKLSNAWMYHSRADAQLILITGKKFDPAPLEDSIASDSDYLQDVLIFGNGRPYPGALLFRSREAAEIPSGDILDDIFPKIDRLNSEGQSHSQISRNMLFVMPFIKNPLQKSSKGTILRKCAETQYESNIENAYRDDPIVIANVTDENVGSHILGIFRSIMSSSSRMAMGSTLQLETDLFAFGFDSVACLQARQAISKLLPSGSPYLPVTIVQDCGSIGKLRDAVIDLRNGHPLQIGTTVDRLERMRDLVNEYCQLDIDYSDSDENARPSPIRPGRPTQTLLLTGSTGSLGSHLLSQLVKSPYVLRIHVLIRAATQAAAEERLRKALSSKHLAIAPNFAAKISIHTFSISKPRLGLSLEVYKMLVHDVDLIYHLAWSVDFLLPLLAFEQHFAGLQALLSLAMHHARYSQRTRSPTSTHFVFCSSAASIASFHKGVVPEMIIEDPAVSGGIGYSSSKWVAENICATVARAYSELDISVVRVGQLSGDSVNGVWNASEAYPLLLSSNKLVGGLPDLSGEVLNWLPVDLAATAFLELGGVGDARREQDCTVRQNGECVQVLHLLSQDNETSWYDLLQWLRKSAGVETLDPREWLARLEFWSQDGSQSHPCLKLLEFWKRAYTDDLTKERDFPLEYTTERSKLAMPVLGQMKPMDKEYALKLWDWVISNVPSLEC